MAGARVGRWLEIAPCTFFEGHGQPDPDNVKGGRRINGCSNHPAPSAFFTRRTALGMMRSGSRFDPLGGQEETVRTQSGQTVVACTPSAADVAWHNGRVRTDRCTVAIPPETTNNRVRISGRGSGVMVQARPPRRVRSFAQPGTSDWRATDTSPRLHLSPTLHTALDCPRRLWDAAKAGLLLPTRGKSSWAMQRPRIHKSRYATSTRPR